MRSELLRLRSSRYVKIIYLEVGSRENQAGILRLTTASRCIHLVKEFQLPEMWPATSLDFRIFLKITRVPRVFSRASDIGFAVLDLFSIQKLKGIEEFPFRNYKSSHYRKMGAAIYQQYFGIEKSD